MTSARYKADYGSISEWWLRKNLFRRVQRMPYGSGGCCALCMVLVCSLVDQVLGRLTTGRPAEKAARFVRYLGLCPCRTTHDVGT